MKPAASVQPNPSCPLCKELSPCAFHSARSPEELGQAFFQALRRKGASALVDFLTSAMANIEQMIPDVLLDKLGELDTSSVEDEFGELLEQDGFDSDDLRRLAALALACALINEQQQDPNDHGTSSKERRTSDHSSGQRRR